MARRLFLSADHYRTYFTPRRQDSQLGKLNKAGDDARVVLPADGQTAFAHMRPMFSRTAVRRQAKKIIAVQTPLECVDMEESFPARRNDELPCAVSDAATNRPVDPGHDQ